MIVSKKYFLYIFCFLTLSYIETNQAIAQSKFSISVKVLTDGKPKMVSGAKIKILKNNKKFKKFVTQQDKSLEIEFDFQNEYLLQFKKKGYTSKEVLVNTVVPKELLTEGFETFPFNVELFKKKSENGKIKNDNPVASVFYNIDTNDFDYKLLNDSISK